MYEDNTAFCTHHLRDKRMETLLTAAVRKPHRLSGLGQAQHVPRVDTEDKKGLGSSTHLPPEWARC